MATLKKGDRVQLANGNSIELLKKLGEGGQGTVYKVDYAGTEYALKWYKSSYLKDLNTRHKQGKKYFKENIEKNIAKGSPNDKFLWPIAITNDMGGCFGYIMGLRPQGYFDFTDIYNTKDKNGNPILFKSFRATVDSALGIVNAFGALHRKGFFYLDLNDGNFFINIETGDVLICDNDNVTADPKYNLGKPGYIAPELVRGDKDVESNALTDAHSLAVVLFRLFMRHDPLMGKNYCSSVCISAEKEIELYGTKPVFIFDPANNSNRPVLNIHSNPIKLWPVYPKYIQDAFIRTFCDGMSDPAKRLVEGEWSKLLLHLSDDILTCPCGQDMLWTDKSSSIVCPKCSKQFVKPCYIEINGYQINLFPGNKITNTHIYEDFSDNDIYGVIVANKHDSTKWGINNTSDDLWNVKKTNGETVAITKDKIISIIPGVEISLPGARLLVIKEY
jgi:serine/threonine protein kinase